jgi:hypothetical protein
MSRDFGGVLFGLFGKFSGIEHGILGAFSRQIAPNAARASTCLEAHHRGADNSGNV